MSKQPSDGDFYFFTIFAALTITQTLQNFCFVFSNSCLRYHYLWLELKFQFDYYNSKVLRVLKQQEIIRNLDFKKCHIFHRNHLNFYPMV